MTMHEQPKVSLRGVVLPALDGTISFDLASGDCLVLLDEDADRRTALLRVIARAAPPVAGTVLAAGAVAVWHEDGMPDDLPVAETLAKVLTDLGASIDPHTLLESIGLTHRAGHEPWAMSLGERRRIAIETAFASSAPVIVLDEPERGLDLASLRWLAGRVRAAQDQGRVVVMATYDAALAEICGDFIVEDVAELVEQRP